MQVTHNDDDAADHGAIAKVPAPCRYRDAEVTSEHVTGMKFHTTSRTHTHVYVRAHSVRLHRHLRR